MAVTEKRKWANLATKPGESEKPRGARITLWACSCAPSKNLYFAELRLKQIAAVLGITTGQLRSFVKAAIEDGVPVTVACFQQHDLAEEKFRHLDAVGKFILFSCHSFDLIQN